MKRLATSLALAAGCAVLLTSCSTTTSAAPEASRAAAGVGDTSSRLPLAVENAIMVDGALVPITLKVTDVDNYDWDGTSRPDSKEHGFQDALLDQARPFLERPLELNNSAFTHSGVHFTLSGIAKVDGSDVEVFKARLRSAPEHSMNFWIFESDLKPNDQMMCGIPHTFTSSLAAPVQVSIPCDEGKMPTVLVESVSGNG